MNTDPELLATWVSKADQGIEKVTEAMDTLQICKNYLVAAKASVKHDELIKAETLLTMADFALQKTLKVLTGK